MAGRECNARHWRFAIAPSIERLRHLPVDGFDALLAESERAGLRLVRTLVDEWASGANRFDRSGEEVIEAARGRFDDLRLSTQNPAAARLYEALGFRPSQSAARCTHVMQLASRRAR